MWPAIGMLIGIVILMSVAASSVATPILIAHRGAVISPSTFLPLLITDERRRYLEASVFTKNGGIYDGNARMGIAFSGDKDNSVAMEFLKIRRGICGASIMEISTPNRRTLTNWRFKTPSWESKSGR